MIWYLAGPITGVKDFNTEAFEREALYLRSKGDIVHNPRELFGGNTSLTHKQYMHIALAIIPLCEGMWMLPGWTRSPGARIEHTIATVLNLKIRGSSA